MWNITFIIAKTHLTSNVYLLMELWVVRLIINGGPTDLFLVPASAPQLV